jgi:hypothetical protein
VLDIVNLEIGFVTLRKPRTLAPRTYLYTDLNHLDPKRYKVLHPDDPNTYVVSRPIGDDTPPRTEAARKAMGIPTPSKPPAESPATTPPPPSSTSTTQKSSSAEATGIQGMLLPGEVSDKPITVTRAVVNDNVVRLSVHGMVRGDKLRLTLKNVVEQVSVAEAGATAPLPAATGTSPPASGATTGAPPTDATGGGAAAGPEVNGTRLVDLQVRQIVTVNEDIGPTFRPNLVYAPNQKLSDGRSKSVWQFPLPFDIPSIAEKNGSNYYLRSDNLISTDSRDLQSRLNFTVGRERNSVRDPGMVPEHLDFNINGNQSVSNLSAGIGYGFRRRWGRGQDPLWVTALRSETAPILSFDTFLNYRFRRDLNASPHHAALWDFGLAPGIEGPPTRLFRLPGSPKPVQFVYGGKVFLLPFEKGANGNSPYYAEYTLNVGVLVPMPRLLGSDRQLRVDFFSGANPAFGYARSQTYSLRLVGATATFVVY